MSARQITVATIAVAFVALSLSPLLTAQEAGVPAKQSTDATGTWQWQFPGPRRAVQVTLKLKQEGEKLTGTLAGPGDEESEIREGVAKDGLLTFKVDRMFGNQKSVTTYTLAITPEGTLKGKSQTVMVREFEGKRKE